LASLLLFFAALFLAYTNGANDNFKGVATLLGSRTINYKKAIGWATVATFAGSLCSIALAQSLVKKFSGKGLVSASVAGTPEFLIAVGMGAGLTVLVATLRGFPISTTHSLIGGLVGAGFMAVGQNLNVAVLGGVFFLPLLLSPFIAITLATLSYTAFRFLRRGLRLKKEMCVCIGETIQVYPIVESGPLLSFSTLRTVEPVLAPAKDCYQRYLGRFFGIRVQKVLDLAHFMSAGAVSFARGLNDTPKIFALLLPLQFLDVTYGLFAVAAGMAIGGLLQAKKVAETISHKITPLNHGQGFTANLVTSFLVIVASRLGVPVSTTHVSVGSLFGIGLVTGRGNSRVISKILLSWVLTLPIAALFSAGIFWIMGSSLQ